MKSDIKKNMTLRDSEQLDEIKQEKPIIYHLIPLLPSAISGMPMKLSQEGQVRLSFTNQSIIYGQNSCANILSKHISIWWQIQLILFKKQTLDINRNLQSWLQFHSTMTQLIDLTLQQPNYNRTANNPNYKLITSAGRFSESDQQREERNRWEFVYQTQQFQFHLLFSIFIQNSSFIINVFLLNPNFQIFKIHSTLETSLLLNSSLKHPNLYQPNIDPSTGFVYFKVSYFDYKKWKGGGYNFNSFNPNEILKLFDIQKLMKSARKLSESGLKSEDNHLSSSIWNDQKSYLQMSKFISKLTQTNDFQQIINKKRTEKNHDKLKKAENIMFVKSMRTVITQNPPQEFHISSIKLQNFMSSLTQDYSKLLTLVKSKTMRSNFDTLLINQSTTKKLNQRLSNMIYERQNSPAEIFKALDAQLGKISIQLSFDDERKFNQKITFLKLLPKNTQYHFLDKYFKSGINFPILLKLSLKDESLGRFLQNNRKTMSLETKMRLMLQLYSAVTTLWEENKILLCVNKMGSIFLTKNLTVKLRGLDSWYRPQHHVLLQGKSEVNEKIAENFLNLTKIYYKIFFNHTMIYIRPTNTNCVEQNLMDYCRTKKLLQNLRNSSIMQGELNGKCLKQFFSGLGYVFGEYIELVRKIFQEQKRRKLQTERFIGKKIEKIEVKKQHYARRQNHFDYDSKLLNHKYFCSWLFKILEGITKQKQ